MGSLSGTGGAVTLGSGRLTVDQATTTSFAGTIAGPGGLTKTGPGTLILTGASTYTGGTEIDAGTLQLGAGGSLASTGVLLMTGGTFDLNGNDQTLAGLSGSGGAITLGSGDLTVNQAGATRLQRQDLRAPAALTKAGAGILGLNGASSYTGATTVNAGTLQLGRRRQPGLDHRAHRQWRDLRSRERRPDRGIAFRHRRRRSRWATAR